MLRSAQLCSHSRRGGLSTTRHDFLAQYDSHDGTDGPPFRRGVRVTRDLQREYYVLPVDGGVLGEVERSFHGATFLPRDKNSLKEGGGGRKRKGEEGSGAH